MTAKRTQLIPCLQQRTHERGERPCPCAGPGSVASTVGARRQTGRRACAAYWRMMLQNPHFSWSGTRSGCARARSARARRHHVAQLPKKSSRKIYSTPTRAAFTTSPKSPDQTNLASNTRHLAQLITYRAVHARAFFVEIYPAQLQVSGDRFAVFHGFSRFVKISTKMGGTVGVPCSGP